MGREENRALWHAAANGKLGEVKRRVAAGADVNYVVLKRVKEASVAEIAARNKHWEVVSFLLNHGADPVRQGTTGGHALRLCRKSGGAGGVVSVLAALEPAALDRIASHLTASEREEAMRRGVAITGGAGHGGEEEAARKAAEEEARKVFTLEQVKAHNKPDDYWIIIDGMVYDVTSFLNEHPGGEEVLLDSAGADATQDFEDVGHSWEAVDQLKDFLIGTLDVASVKEAARKAAEEEAARKAAEKEAARKAAEKEAARKAAEEEAARKAAEEEAARKAAEEEVAQWLRKCRLDMYIPVFEANQVLSLEMLLLVDEALLPDFVSNVLHRKLFVKKQNELRAQLEGGGGSHASAAPAQTGIAAEYTPTDEPAVRGRNTITFATGKHSHKAVVIKTFGSAAAMQHEARMMRVVGEVASQTVLPLLLVSPAERALVMARGQFSLREFITRYPTPQDTKAGGIAYELLDALKAVHSIGHVHCDVKPDNFVFYDMRWRLIDFGGARAVGSTGGDEFEFTHTFVAPEVARALLAGDAVRVDKAQDVWALGLTVYYMLAGKELFTWDKAEALTNAAQLTQDAVVITPGAVASKAARKLLGRMLRVDAAERAAVAELLADSFVAGSTHTTTARKLNELADQLEETRLDAVGAKHAAEDAAEFARGALHKP